MGRRFPCKIHGHLEYQNSTWSNIIGSAGRRKLSVVVQVLGRLFTEKESDLNLSNDQFPTCAGFGKACRVYKAASVSRNVGTPTSGFPRTPVCVQERGPDWGRRWRWALESPWNVGAGSQGGFWSCLAPGPASGPHQPGANVYQYLCLCFCPVGNGSTRGLDE